MKRKKEKRKRYVDSPFCPTTLPPYIRYRITYHLLVSIETERQESRQTTRESLEGGTISSVSRRKGQVYGARSVRWWEKEGALAKRAERERESEGGPRKRTGRKEERKKERKEEREVCTRACALWSPVGLPFNRWLDSPTHSFIHTRCTRFESISKPRKRIFPIGLAWR